MKLFVLLAFLVAGTQAWVHAPYVGFQLSHQTHYFLIDINGQESYIQKGNPTGFPRIDTGYQVNETDYKSTDEKFHYVLSNATNHVNIDISGTYGSATFYGYKKVPDVRVNFGLVDKLSAGNPYAAFPDDNIRHGRLAMNYGRGEAKTTLAQAWYGEKQPIFGYLATCKILEDGNSQCYTAWTFKKCHDSTQVFNDTVIVPAVPHESKFWQVRFNSYQVGNVISKRPFKAILSTTTADFHVPRVVFDSIFKLLNPRIEKNIYVYDCNRQHLLKDIVLTIDDKKITIKPEIYGNSFLNVCSLRLRPTTGDFWVLGLQWFQSYATCLNPDKNTVQFNSINPEKIDSFKNGLVNEPNTFAQIVRS